MKDFKVLKFLDRFKSFFEKLGIDYNIMRRILQVKLTMDGRRVPTIIGNSSKSKEQGKNKDENSFKKSLYFYGLMGVFFLIPFIIMDKSYIFQMSFAFGILMFMLMTSLISDFSSVLLDVRDKNIIFSKPVDNKTLSMAKIVHIFIYMFFITISFSGAGLVVALIKHGILFFILFLLEIILMDLFIVVLTALLYLLILKFFDGEKLKDIINYVQIILTIAITVGYQFLGRLFDLSNLNIVFVPKWWQYIIAPIWFGAPFELILNGTKNIYYVIFSILALVVPIISIIIYIKLIPTFERNLQKLNNNISEVKKGNNKFSQWTSNIICFSKQEKIFFRFASDMMKNEREFKLKVYPSLGFALIFPFIFIFNELRSESFSTIASGKMYLNIYFCALLLPTVVMMIKYSEKYKGAWIYKAIPINDISAVFKGTLKAFIVKLLAPIYIVECIIFIFIFGLRILPDLVLVFLSILLFATLCFKFLKTSLPFSQKYEAAQQSEGLIMIPLMMLLGVLAGIHYACTFLNYTVYMYILVMIVLNIVMWKKTFNISWDKLS